MTPHTSRPLRSASLLSALLVVVATACNPGDIGGIDGVLSLPDASPDTTGTADYVVDFGDTGVGRRKLAGLIAWNAGRGPLTIFTVDAQAPFTAKGAVERILVIDERVSYEFEFAPTVAGTVQQLVTLSSDGGEFKVLLKGRGVVGLAACVLVPQPATLEFGQVPLNSSRTLSTSVKNDGVEPCAIDQVRMGSATNSAFTFISGAPPARSLAAGDSLLIEVVFRPTISGSASGMVEVHFGGTDVLRVNLLGRFEAPCADPLPDGSCPVARETIYVNSSEALFSFDSATRRATKVGNFKQGGTTITGMTDIAIDTDGIIWGVTATKLYRINPNSAGCLLVGPVTGSPNGLTVLPDGRLVAAGVGIWEINRTTGAVADTIVGTNTAYETSGDVVALPDGQLYWVVKGPSSDRIVRVDPDTGNTTVLGATGTSSIYGIGYADGDLWGFTSGSKALKINPNTGVGSGVVTVSGNWWGATTNPTQW